jgi:hypothetical protein
MSFSLIFPHTLRNNKKIAHVNEKNMEKYFLKSYPTISISRTLCYVGERNKRSSSIGRYNKSPTTNVEQAICHQEDEDEGEEGAETGKKFS